jgi:hypothetical protein
MDKNPNYLGRESINSGPVDTYGNVPIVNQRHITFLGYLSFILLIQILNEFATPGSFGQTFAHKDEVFLSYMSTNNIS